MPENENIAGTNRLISPNDLKRVVKLSERWRETRERTVQTLREMIYGQSEKIAIIVWPCSIHDVQAAKEYAEKIKKIREQAGDILEVIMRVYFEKPRTNVGWKWLISDPHLDGTENMQDGILIARQLMIDIADMEIPTATEFLDPIMPQYLGDAVSWWCVWARTTESQTHRQMASGLSMPIGFKNSTDWNVANAINGIRAAAGNHEFLGVDGEGFLSTVKTRGNPHTHIVLRGGKQPNYDAKSIEEVVAQLERAGLPQKVLIDASHENSGKDHIRQGEVVENIIEQLTRDHARQIMGVMMESHLEAGNQKFEPGSTSRESLRYWVSITDKCMDWATTENLILRIHEWIKKRK